MSASFLLAGAILLAAPAAFAGQPSPVSSFETIYLFTTADGDGGIPEDTPDLGTVYRVDLRTGALRILYSFKGGRDGKRPQGALIESGGVLYGTTFEGGGHDCRAECGTLFSIDPSSGAATILHAFTGAKDAQYPFGSMTANAGILYGASLYGGSAHHGAIFAYDTNAKSETVVKSFTKAHEGAVPIGVTYDNGALYGGTLVGGDSGYGVEWRIDPATGREQELHEFTGGEDGGLAYGAPAVRGGYWYGTTYQGDIIADCPDMGCGTIFRIKAK